MHRATNQFIKLELRDEHKRLCTQYKDSITDDEAHTRYLAIRSWWFTSGAAMESEIPLLDAWLAWWHFRYRQWGGYMNLVSLHVYLLLYS
jgi:hypothetical protein